MSPHLACVKHLCLEMPLHEHEDLHLVDVLVLWLYYGSSYFERESWDL